MTTIWIGISYFLLAAAVPQPGDNEDRYLARNIETAERYQYRMLELVDEFSDCAGFYSLAVDQAIGAAILSSTETKPEDLQQHFMALGADALESIDRAPRSQRLLEMESRMNVSRRELQDSFGGLGGTIQVKQENLHRACLKLRKSKRKSFGWSKP